MDTPPSDATINNDAGARSCKPRNNREKCQEGRYSLSELSRGKKEKRSKRKK